MSDLQTGYTWSDDKANWETNEATAIRLNRMMEDTQMNILAGANVTVTRSSSGVTIASTAPGTGTVTSVATGTGLTGGPITTSGTIVLANTAVTAGAYTNSNITVDAQGRLTSAANGSAGGVTSVTGTAPVVSSGGATPAISMAAATTSVDGYLSSADWTTFNNKGSGTVTSVAATSPVTSSGGTTPTIAIPAATTSVDGYLTSTDWNTFNNKSNTSGTVTSVAATAGTGITVSGSPITTSGTLTITNSAPDQTVALTASTGISTSGTYPNFTITNSAPDQTVAIAAGTGISVSGTYPSFTVTNSSPSSGGTVTSVGGTGTVNGITLSGTVTSSGNLTLGGTLSGVNLTSQVTGVLPQANGGTGQITLGAGLVTVAGTGATAVSLANRFAQIVNVKSFGATGNGTTDDHAAIVLAMKTLTDNSCLYFPAGVYIISDRASFDVADAMVTTSSYSISSITRVSTTATVTTAVAHGLSTGKQVLISGAVETDYNGWFSITVTSTTTFTYTVAGSPATPATGTILYKLSLTNISIVGDGIGVTTIRRQRTGALLQGGIVFNVPKGSSYFSLSNFTADGNCIARVPGQNGINVAANNTILQNIEIINAGQFTLAAGRYDGNYMNNLCVMNCLIKNGYADGINFNYVDEGIISNNQVDEIDDDCIALGESKNIVVTGNFVKGRQNVYTQIPVLSLTSVGTTATVTYSSNNFFTANPISVTIAGATPAGYNGTFSLTPTGTGPGYTSGTYTLAGALASPATGTITIVLSANSGYTTWGRGIWASGGNNNLIANNYIFNSKQYGIYILKESTTRPTGFCIKDNVLNGVATLSGNGISLIETTDCLVEGNHVLNPITGDCIEIGDWQNLTIKGGHLEQSTVRQGRGIHAVEGSGYAASWDNLRISDVSIKLAGTSNSECVYLSPHSSVTMNTLVVDNVIGKQSTAGDYIYVASARAGTLAKIVNNTDMAGSKTVAPASGGIFTTVNNN